MGISQILLLAGITEFLLVLLAAWLGWLGPRARRMRARLCTRGRVTGYRRGAWSHEAGGYLYFPLVAYRVGGRRYTVSFSDLKSLRYSVGCGTQYALHTLYTGAPEIGQTLEVCYSAGNPSVSRLRVDRLTHRLRIGLRVAGIGLAVAAAEITGVLLALG